MKIVRVVVWALLGALSMWAAAALSIDGPGAIAALCFLVAAGCALAFLRPIGRAAIGIAVLGLGVVLWWSSLAASNDREWLADVARPPTVEFAGDRVTIRNVRTFHYRSETDFDARWEDRTIDLRKVTGLDFAMSYWGSPWIAHTIMSWTFEDAPPLAISIETRKEVGEGYSAVLGFFRQFELFYVIADERDLLGLRTHHRGEQVYMYRLTIEPENARKLLVDYLETADRLAREPRWYNAATHNCTTTIRRHMQHIAQGHPFDWRILVNGRLDELGYERGTVDTSLPFPELRRRSLISERAAASPIDDEYSERIRDGLPLPAARVEP